jgi:hypothetical protein
MRMLLPDRQFGIRDNGSQNVNMISAEISDGSGLRHFRIGLHCC